MDDKSSIDEEPVRKARDNIENNGAGFMTQNKLFSSTCSLQHILLQFVFWYKEL